MAHHDLVEKVLDELLLQRPRSEKPVQIRPEELGDKVAAHPLASRCAVAAERIHSHVLERGDEDVAERDDVLVLQVLQQLQLSICPLREHRCAEGLHDLLDGDILVGELVAGGAASTARQ